LPPERPSDPVVDADVHAVLPSVDALLPYLEPQWVEWVQETGFTEPFAVASVYPPGAPTTMRPEWAPATTLADLQRHVLDPLGVEHAVLSCYWGLESVRHPDFGAALAAGLNDWLATEWLARDTRLRGSISVGGHDPAAIAGEIDRVGAHPGFVQVLLPVRSSRLYGNRLWHPVFAAIERNDLVAGIHFGGVGDGPPTPVGYPSWYLEEYTGAVQVFFAQLTSLIGEGTFERFPGLRVALLEGGFTWLPSLMWRLDKEWKGLRRDIPWVRRPPSETIRERVRLSVQPLDAGPPEQLAEIVDELGSDGLLMFATDYPHAHEQDVDTLLGVLDGPARAKLLGGNARELYRL